MSIQSWAVRFGNTPTGDGDWDMPRGRWLFLLRLPQLVDTPLILTEKQWDRVASNAAFYSAHPMWDPSRPIEERLKLLECLASLAVRAAREAPQRTSGVSMFWDILISPGTNVDMSALPGIAFSRRPDAELRERLYQILCKQVAAPDKNLQLSGLHGLNHLGDRRTPNFVKSIGHQLMDDEVRQFAAAAARFSLP